MPDPYMIQTSMNTLSKQEYFTNNSEIIIQDEEQLPNIAN